MARASGAKHAAVRTGAIIMIVLLCTLAGCGDADERAPAVAPSLPGENAPDVPLAEQLTAVRDGKTDVIRLWHTDFNDAEAAMIAAEPGVVRLITNRGGITDHGVAKLTALPKLETLRLCSPHITDESLRHLAGSKTLRHLILVGTPVTDEGLSHLLKLTTLESLYLTNTRVTEAGLESLLRQRPGLHVH